MRNGFGDDELHGFAVVSLAVVVAAAVYFVGAHAASISNFTRGAEFVGLGFFGYSPRWQRLFLSKRKKRQG